MAKADYQEIIAEYKEQVRVLKEQVNELTDACKKTRIGQIITGFNDVFAM